MIYIGKIELLLVSIYLTNLSSYKKNLLFLVYYVFRNLTFLCYFDSSKTYYIMFSYYLNTRDTSEYGIHSTQGKIEEEKNNEKRRVLFKCHLSVLDRWQNKDVSCQCLTADIRGSQLSVLDSLPKNNISCQCLTADRRMISAASAWRLTEKLCQLSAFDGWHKNNFSGQCLTADRRTISAVSVWWLTEERCQLSSNESSKTCFTSGS